VQDDGRRHDEHVLHDEWHDDVPVQHGHVQMRMCHDQGRRLHDLHVRRQGDVRNAASLLRLHVHVHEGRLYVLHDARRYAHVLRLLLLVASIDGSKLVSSLRNIAPHHRGFTVVVVRPLFPHSPFCPVAS
jgi:hypothetical protein